MKKLLKSTMFLILLLTVFLVGTVNVFASEQGFITNDISESNTNAFVNRIDFKRIEDEPFKRAISSFDVNENNEIVIGIDRPMTNRVCIYSADNTFEYGYEFSINGSFLVKWDNENISICFVREQLELIVAPNGDVIKASNIEDNDTNNTYWNQLTNLRSKQIGDYKYIMKNITESQVLSDTPCSKLIKRDSNGNETLLYKALPENIIEFLCIIALFSIMFTIAFKKIKSNFKRNKEPSENVIVENNNIETKDNNISKSVIKPNPIMVSLFSTFVTLLVNWFFRFGYKQIDNFLIDLPFFGSIFIAVPLLIPLLNKKYRKTFWTKKEQIILIVALVINVAIGIFTVITRYKLYGIL